MRKPAAKPARVLGGSETMDIPKIDVSPLRCSHDFNGAVIGMALGDAYLDSYANREKAHDPRIHKARLQLAHGEKQRGYFLWKISLVRNYLTFTSMQENKCMLGGKEYKSVKAMSLGSKKLSYLYPKLYQFRKKRVTRKILNRLTTLGLAIWYMDDGYLEKKKAPDGSYYPGRAARLHTEGFSHEEILVIISYFKEVLGISALAVRCTNGHEALWFNTENAKKLFDLVRPYVLRIECMKYKLPEFSIEAPVSGV